MRAYPGWFVFADTPVVSSASDIKEKRKSKSSDLTDGDNLFIALQVP